ncbi:hypothetical protein WA171_001019, partial [Blastocystis sp. BT1]
MRNEFKHVRNLLSNTINIILLWILQYIWTLPGFVVVLSYLYSNQTFRNVADSVVKWFNRKIEDYVYLSDGEKRVALIIGADNAVGYCLARKLVRKNYHVIMGVKSTKVGLRMKRKLLAYRPYIHVTVLSVDMSNPMNVFYFAKRVRHIIKRIDVLYLNSSVLRIESLDWNVMYETLRSRSIGYLFTAGRSRPDGKYMITPANLGVGDDGFSIEFCQQVLCPFILIQELKVLLASANLPGRVVWAGSSTCSHQAFDWEDPQHLHGHLSFYSHKYLTHLLQPAINEMLRDSGVQSFEACPGLIVTGTSPKFFRNMSWIIYVLGYFYPTIQLRPAAGARTLLHIGTHRREYRDLDPNHLYYMQWRLKGLERSPFVEDVNLAESRDAYQWIFGLYKKLKNTSLVVGETSEKVKALSKTDAIARNR